MAAAPGGHAFSGGGELLQCGANFWAGSIDAPPGCGAMTMVSAGFPLGSAEAPLGSAEVPQGRKCLLQVDHPVAI